MFAMNFRRQGVAGTSSANLRPVTSAAQGIAHLHEDVRKHAVHRQTVVEPLTRQFLEIGGGHGRIRVVKFDGHLFEILGVGTDFESEQGNVIGADAGKGDRGGAGGKEGIFS